MAVRLGPNTPVFPAELEARVEPGSLEPRFVVVDTHFAERLTSHHAERFEVVARVLEHGAEQLTRDVPNVGEAALEHLDERGLVRVGTAVSPGSLLVGKVRPRAGAVLTQEEKLLAAIFGEAVGQVLDASLRAPPGCFGHVSAAELDPSGTQAVVTVAWTRPLDIGDTLELSGVPATVVDLRPLGADLGWSGGHARVSVRKIAMARDVLHARSVGPYLPPSQQPTAGRDAFGGQRLTRAQVQLLSTHLPWMLWECLTIKADDVLGRMRTYDALVRGENPAPKVEPPRDDSGPPPSAGDIFAFFDQSKRQASSLGDPPQVIKLLSVLLKALGLEVSLDREFVGASLLDDAALRALSSGDVTLERRFSQRIFGPLDDYRCECGRYSRMKDRGKVCKRCGVEVIQSKVRGERFGRFALPQPLVHPLYRAEVATLLGLSEEALERRELEDGLGLRAQLEALDLEAMDAIETGAVAALVTALLDTGQRPAALMVDAVAVLPPDLRPAGSSLDSDYQALLGATSARSLRASLDRLFETLSTTVSMLWRERTFEKCVDYSAVAALVVEPGLPPGRCKVPRAVLTELFRPLVYGALEAQGQVTTIRSAKRMVDEGRPEALQALEEVISDYPLLLAAGERLVCRVAEPWDAPAIAVDLDTARRLREAEVCLYVPLCHEAIIECHALPDGATTSPPEPTGWLSTAMAEPTVVAAARHAALTGAREGVRDPALAAALGRLPAPRDPQALEAWTSRWSAARLAYRETHRPPPPEPAPWSSRGIDELELSVKTANALMRAQIETIGDLVQKTERELLALKGFGPKSAQELKEILAELGLSLGTPP